MLRNSIKVTIKYNCIDFDEPRIVNLITYGVVSASKNSKPVTSTGCLRRKVSKNSSEKSHDSQ